ncbi:MAG: multiheme c-type cytochrome [Methanosarcinaceae archaeon]
MVTGIVSGTSVSDCIECHDVANTTTEYNVSVSSMNQSDNIHANLNSAMNADAASSTSNADNSMCWGCHVSAGSEPLEDYNCSNAIPSNCYECHDGTDSSAPEVKEHFKSGEDIKAITDAANATESCIRCHNLDEMKNSAYTEPDASNTNLSLASHYGIKRDDIVALDTATSAYCMYCHNNGTTAFPVTNNSMTSHISGSACTNPSCHADGRIHYGSLEKHETGGCEYCHSDKMDTTVHSPGVTCLQCHNNKTLDYSGTKLSPGSYNAKTTIHTTNIIPGNNASTSSPLCTECHTKTVAEIQEGYENVLGGYAMMDDSSNLAPYGSNMTHKKNTAVEIGGVTFYDIMGTDPPDGNVTYARHANPNTDGGWDGARSRGERPPNQICINCHTDVLEDIKAMAGTGYECDVCHNLWGNDLFIAIKPPAHNLSKPDCSVCHHKYEASHVRHTPAFLGLSVLDLPKYYYNVLGLQGGNIVDMMDYSVHVNMIGNVTAGEPTNQIGCLVCHTNVSFAIDYTAGNNLDITITDRSGIHTWNSNPDCTKCHSLTGTSEGPTIHSHIFVDEGNNTQCLERCHDGTERPFIDYSPSLDRGHGHDVKPAGGSDCIACHDIGEISPKVNFSIMNDSLSVHQNIQNYSIIKSVDETNNTNKICWACHMNDSQYTDTTNKAHADKLGEFNGVPVYTCDECHIDDITGIMPDSVLVKEHFYGGTELKAGNSIDDLTSCVVCHNLSEMKLDVILDNTVGGTDPEDRDNASYLIAHYGKKRGTGADNIRTWDGGVNCSYCHQDSNSAFANSSIMVNPAFNSSIPDHSGRYPSSPANNCTNENCHNGGWMHNASLTKPAGLTTNYSDGEPSSQVCLKCHGPGKYTDYTPVTGLKQRHSDTLDCTECHLYEARDIHGVKYLQKDDTYSTSNNTAVDCVRCHNDKDPLNNISMFRPLVPTNNNVNFAHSEDPDNGSRWNETSYWDSTESACDYCHGDTKHNSSALGPIEAIRDGQELNTSIDSSDRWCGGCHYEEADNYKGWLWDPIPPTIVINNANNNTAYDDSSIEWFNHSISSYDDMICAACHGSLLSDNSTTKELAHNAAVGAFGPDCISCHDADSMSPKINVSVVISNSAIHSKIAGYPDSIIDNTHSGVSDDNKICWACHMDNARTPGPNDHADRWILNGVYPYTCDECHVENIVTNLSGLIPLVEEHFFNGTNLVINQGMTSNISSCLVCHNENEMRLETEFDGTNSDLSLVSHYGKNRSDIRTWTSDSNGANIINCSYCHSNESSIFRSYMRNAGNSDIDEHSRYGSTPSCTNSTCHGGVRMHDASLAKPVLMENGAEDSGVCLLCHDPANYSTYMSYTSPKSRHNDTLNCSECHLSEARDIHGVKYLQKNGTFSMSNSSVVDCYTCHSSGAVDTKINATIPKVPDNNYGFGHSDAPTSGSRWNEIPYWNDSNEACEFCHDDTKHETIAIGPIINISADDSHVALTDGSTSELCSGCHIEDKIRYNTILRPQAPPTICVNNIGNNTSWDGTGQGWYDHSSISNFYDVGCKGCHGSSLSTDPTTAPTNTEFVHNVAKGGGKYCVECHNTINMSMTARFQIDVQAMNKSDAIHYDLNRAAIAGMNRSYSPDNVRCWACHGEGDGSDADQPESHPERVLEKNPRNCSNMDCHNVNQSLFYEPMVYEHFKYVDQIDENVSTEVNCTACHINSIMLNYDPNPENSTDTSMVSHYGSTDDLINTTSCIYCHLDEDNAEEWGDAPDPTTNISRLSDEELEITMLIGDKWHLGNRYFLVFADIGVDGDCAFLKLYQNDSLIDEIVVYDAYNYTYDDDFIDPDGDEISDLVVLELNFTAVFRGEQTGLVMIEGKSWKRIHPENKDPACWACHMDNHRIEKNRYLVLDEDEDLIYYIEKLLDFSDDDTDDKVTLMPENLVLGEGYKRTLQINEEYVLTAEEIDVKGHKAYLTLTRNDVVIEEGVYSKGEDIEHEDDLSYDGHDIDDFMTFTASIGDTFRGEDCNLVSFTDIKIFSGNLLAFDIDDDDKLGGYNTSYLHANDTFSIGGYPDTFHVPPLNEGLDGGSDCVRCHDTSHRFGISSVDAIQSRLGGHSGLNANATGNVGTDDINKACWACHGEGDDPGQHPADYLYPRQCKDCHVDMEEPTYGAVDLSNEAHGQVEDCNKCHAADYPGLHVINVFEPAIPYIIRVNVSPVTVMPGDPVTVDFTAIAGWNMQVKAVEYFIDVKGSPGTGTQIMSVDGTFDQQEEDGTFTIDTDGLGPGEHTIYIQAMERDNKWGPVTEVMFSIDTEIPAVAAEQKDEPSNIGTILMVGGASALGLLLLLLWKKGFMLFNWDSVPGDDSEKVINLLKDKFHLDWAENAVVSKSADGKTILVSNDGNSAEIMMNATEENVTVKMSDGRTHDLKVKMEKETQNIYGFFMPFIGKR